MKKRKKERKRKAREYVLSVSLDVDDVDDDSFQRVKTFCSDNLTLVHVLLFFVFFCFGREAEKKHFLIFNSLIPRPSPGALLRGVYDKFPDFFRVGI